MSRPLKKEFCDEIHIFNVCPSLNRGGGIQAYIHRGLLTVSPKLFELCLALRPHSN